MPEITRYYVVSTPPRLDGSLDWIWTDPSLKDDESRLHQFLDVEGHSLDRLVSLYLGTEKLDKGRWVKERTKVYSDVESAQADALKRYRAARNRYIRRHPGRKIPNRI